MPIHVSAYEMRINKVLADLTQILKCEVEFSERNAIRGFWAMTRGFAGFMRWECVAGLGTGETVNVQRRDIAEALDVLGYEVLLRERECPGDPTTDGTGI